MAMLPSHGRGHEFESRLTRNEQVSGSGPLVGSLRQLKHRLRDVSREGGVEDVCQPTVVCSEVVPVHQPDYFWSSP